MPRCTRSTQLSPPLSPITDITENVQSHRTKHPFKILCEESHVDQILETACSVNGQANVPKVKNILPVRLSLSESSNTPHKASETDENVQAENNITDDNTVIKPSLTNRSGKSETSVQGGKPKVKVQNGMSEASVKVQDGMSEAAETGKDATHTETLLTHSNDNVECENKSTETEEQTRFRKKDRKNSKRQWKKIMQNKNDNKTLDTERQKESENFRNSVKSAVKTCMNQKPQKLKTIQSSNRAGIRNKNTVARPRVSLSRGIKSRLRSSHQKDKIMVHEKNDADKNDANNSAIDKNLSSNIAKTGSGDTDISKTKLIEGTKSNSEQFDVFPQGKENSHIVRIKVELPMSDVSHYDLADMEQTDMEGIPVLITSKKTLDFQPENVPEEIFKDIPLSTKQKIFKKRVENTQRKTLKISAQLKDKQEKEIFQVSDADCQKISTTGYKSTYKALTPKQLELTAPLFSGPDPNIVQENRKILCKPVKSQDIAMGKKQTENLTTYLKNEHVFPSVEGTKVYDTILKEKRHRGLSDGLSKDIKYGSAQELLFTSDYLNQTSMSHEENNLGKQKVHSAGSVSRNQYERETLQAEGKKIKAFVRTKDLNSSEFVKERITMWKEEVAQNMHYCSPKRPTKSATLVGKQTVCTRRPNSSMFSSRIPEMYNGGSATITGLHGVCSRKHAFSNIFDQRNSLNSSAKETLNMYSEKLLENDNSDDLQKGLKIQSGHCFVAASLTTPQTPKEGHFISLENPNDVQNYGSSSSTTPDIYDEFARKRKPKPPKPDCSQIRPKPVTSPLPTSLMQPVVYTKTQTAPKVCTKQNFHTVGYMSCAESSDKDRSSSISSMNQSIKQMYQHTDSSVPQNLPYNSMMKTMNALLPDQSHLDNISHIENGSSKADKNGSQRLCKEDECRTSVPVCLVPNERNSTEFSQAGTSGVQSSPSLHYFASRTQNWLNPHMEVQQDHGNLPKSKLSSTKVQTESKCPTSEKQCTFANTISSYRTHNLSEGKLEALEYVNSIRSALGIYPFCSSELKSDQLESNFQPEEVKMCDKDTTKETVLFKVNTQLYYKLPNDDQFYPVSENMMIPKHAQFFVQANLTENTGMIPHTKQDPRSNDSFSENAFKLEENISKLKTPEGSHEINKSDTVIDRNPLKNKQNECRDEDISGEKGQSDTVFDSNTKASEKYMDKSKQISHMISETQLALERAKEDDIDYNFGNGQQTAKASASNQNVKNSNKLNEVDPEKNVIASVGLIVSTQRKYKSQKKSFKKVVEEKQAEKTLVQQELSKKKFWNSAYMKKGAQFQSTRNYNFYTKEEKIKCNKREVGTHNKSVKQENIVTKQKSNMDKANISQPERTINSKFLISTQPKPKTFITKTKERATKTCGLTGVRKRTTDSCSSSEKTYCDYVTKQTCERMGHKNNSKYQQTAKPITLYHRTRNLNSYKQKEADDCTKEILTPLRKLCIEKASKKDETESLRKEACQQNLRSKKPFSLSSSRTFVNRHTGNKDNNAESTVKSEMDNEEHNSEVAIEQTIMHTDRSSNTEKIQVVISPRNDCVTPQNSFDFSGYDTNDCAETANGQSHTNFMFQSSDTQESYLTCGPRTDKLEKHCDQITELGDETFIKQYNTREMALFDTVQTSSSRLHVDGDKYLGIPYFQEVNSNMDNTEINETKIDLPDMGTQTDAVWFNQGSLQEQELFSDIPSKQKAELRECKNTKQGLDKIHVSAANTCVQELTKHDCLKLSSDAINLVNSQESDVLSGGHTIQNYTDVCSSMSGVEFTEMLLNSSFSKNLCNKVDVHNTESDTNSGFNLASGNEVVKNVAEKEKKPENQIHQVARYTNYDLSEDRKLDETKGIIMCNERNTDEQTDKNTCQLLAFEAADEAFQYIYEPIPEWNLNTEKTDNSNLSVSESHISGNVMVLTNEKNVENVKSIGEANDQEYDYTGLINEDWDHYYQLEIPADTSEIQEQYTRVFGCEISNSVENNSDSFLDETECGQQVCIGDRDNSDINKLGLECGIGSLYENDNCLLQTNTHNSENCNNINHEDVGQSQVSNSGETATEESLTIARNEEEETYASSKNDCPEKIGETQTSNTEASSSSSRDSCKPRNTTQILKTKNKKKKRQIQRNKQVQKNEVDFGRDKDGYSPSDSEAEASIIEIKKDTEIVEQELEKSNSRRPHKETLSDYNDVDEKSADDNDASFDSDADDEDDGDYNPEDDSDFNDSSSEGDDELKEDVAGSFAKSRKIKAENASSNRKYGISLDNIRKKFQKKYDVKNCSTIHNLKKSSLRAGSEEMQHSTKSVKEGQNISNTNHGSKEKSIVREFCFKKKKSSNVHLEKRKSNKKEKSDEKKLIGYDCTEMCKSEEFDVTDGKQDHESVKMQSKNLKGRFRKNKRNKNTITDEGAENAEVENKSIAAEGFIKTQKLYYEILRKSSISEVKDDIQEHAEKRYIGILVMINIEVQRFTCGHSYFM